MRVYELKREQFLPVNINEAWKFFSNPANLNKITPPSLKFRIISGAEGEMYAGQIICYRIRIIPGITTTWVTEIKSVESNRSFIDEQRFGPYKLWYHRHSFVEKDGGVLMTDHVHYALPLGLAGRFIHLLFIKNRISEIFNYRYNWLDKYFNRRQNPIN